MKSADDSAFVGCEAIQSREPTAEFAAQFIETFDRLFEELNDPDLQQVVALRMAGHTDSEIADNLNCSRRTVQRRLEVIRRTWNGVSDDE